MHIPGTVAIVTGGSRGLGKAFSEELLKRGCKVCFGDINELEGKETERLLKQAYGSNSSMFVKCDVRSQDDLKALWKAALDRFKTINLVVNNAGILKEDQLQATVDINLVGVMQGSMMAFDHMRKDKGGKGGVVINVASTAGLVPVFFMPAYVASKHGVIGFTSSWATNPSQKVYGVNFAMLCPSFTDTKMVQDVQNNRTFTVTQKENYQTALDDNYQKAMDVIDYFGINRVDEVAAAFVELVETDENNGIILCMDKRKGRIYKKARQPFKL